MTDTVFYDDLAALAEELMTDFGMLATLRRIVMSEVGADGKATKTPTDFPGLAVQTENEKILTRLVSEAQAAFVFKAPEVASIGDHLIFQVTEWEVKDVKNVNPEGNRLVLQILGVVKP